MWWHDMHIKGGVGLSPSIFYSSRIRRTRCLSVQTPVLPSRPKWKRTGQTIRRWVGGWSVSTSLMNLLACPRWSGPSHQIDSEHPSVLPTFKCIDRNQLTCQGWWNRVTLAVEPFVAVFGHESAMLSPSHGIFFLSLSKDLLHHDILADECDGHTHTQRMWFITVFSLAHIRIAVEQRLCATVGNVRRHRKERQIWPLALHKDDLCLPTWRKKGQYGREQNDFWGREGTRHRFFLFLTLRNRILNRTVSSIFHRLVWFETFRPSVPATTRGFSMKMKPCVCPPFFGGK